MRVLITGGAGFIGSHLCDAFLERGDEVYAIDNVANGRESRLNIRVILKHADITDGPQLYDLITSLRPQLICHLAARVSVRVQPGPPSQDVAVNIAGAVTALEAARKIGARLVLASSAAVYGQATGSPLRETSPTLPVSLYGTSKLCAEYYARLYTSMHGTSNAVLRLANVYGPRQLPRTGAAVAGFCYELSHGQHPLIYGDGKQVRDFIHVSDVCSAFLAAADSELNGTWNVSTGAGTSILGLADLVAAVAGRSEVSVQFAPVQQAEIRWSVLDPGMAATELGWKPSTELTEGVQSVLHWIAEGLPWRGR